MVDGNLFNSDEPESDIYIFRGTSQFVAISESNTRQKSLTIHINGTLRF